MIEIISSFGPLRRTCLRGAYQRLFFRQTLYYLVFVYTNRTQGFSDNPHMSPQGRKVQIHCAGYAILHLSDRTPMPETSSPALPLLVLCLRARQRPDKCSLPARKPSRKFQALLPMASCLQGPERPAASGFGREHS